MGLHLVTDAGERLLDDGVVSGMLTAMQSQERSFMTQKRVLIIDDDRYSADTLAELLRLSDADLSTVVGYDGETAVSLALAQRPDAAIIDLELPRLGGAEAAVKIRAALPDAAPLLIALSGNIFKVAKARHGTLFDHALSKPIDMARLLSILLGTEP